MQTREHITFVGVGAIGLPMAALLQRDGHDVVAVDPGPGAGERATSAGLSGFASTISSATRTGTVIVMVATPEQLAELVSEALLTPEPLVGQRWIIMSTVGPDAVRSSADRLIAAGATVLDAPVTGGVARAVTGDLVIFASGSDEDLAASRSVLALLGSVRSVGPNIGDGQAIKVVNQHLCSVHIVAAAEALNLASALGLDPGAVLALIEGGAAGSWMLSDRGPRMLLGTDAPVTSTINIFVKDSTLVAEAAAMAGADVTLLELSRTRYLAAAAAGLQLRDDSRVIETYSASFETRNAS